ncbi:MAG: heavy-metal-associated domain-containing protein [Pararhodobacter sp.]|nr:heavy-metal-associated domain-containing protein [Pararhodobacter sp.]
MSAPLTLSVPDMSCGHCRASIEAALAPLGATPQFDMQARRITLPADAPQAAVIAALDAIGFEAAPVATRPDT